MTLNIATEFEAQRGKHWMKQGPSAAEDWRAIPMADLRPLLEAGKVHLQCFTAEAQAEKRRQIMEATA